MKITAVLLCLLFAAVAQAQHIVTEYKQTDSGTVRIKKEVSEKILSAQKIASLTERNIAELNTSGSYTGDKKIVTGFGTVKIYSLIYSPDKKNGFNKKPKKENDNPFSFWVPLVVVLLISVLFVYADYETRTSARLLMGIILVVFLGITLWINIDDYYHNPLREYLSVAQLFSSSIFIVAIFVSTFLSLLLCKFVYKFTDKSEIENIKST